MQTVRLAEQIIIKGPIHPNYRTSQIVLVLFVQVLSSLSEISASTQHSGDHSTATSLSTNRVPVNLDNPHNTLE